MTNLDISTFKQTISFGDVVSINLKKDATEYSLAGKGHTYFPSGLTFPDASTLVVKGIYVEPSMVDMHSIDEYIRLYDIDTKKTFRVHMGAAHSYMKEKESYVLSDLLIA